MSELLSKKKEFTRKNVPSTFWRFDPVTNERIELGDVCGGLQEGKEPMKIPFQESDGGRSHAGYKGEAGDCAVRAVAIATQLPYQQIYDEINRLAQRERKGKRKDSISNARTGVHKVTMVRLMNDLGWTFTPTMSIGSGCKVHLRPDELPKGRLILSLSRHYAAFIDGVLYDMSDCSRGGTRCVYGYWSKK